MSPHVYLAAVLALFVTVAIPTHSIQATESETDLRLTLDTPQSGMRIATSEGRVFLSGRALATGGKSGRFDVVVVIDKSTSTMAPSGADVDGDGKLGRKQGSKFFPFITWMLSTASTDEGDSILAAEVAAARTLLGQLDPTTTRVGVVAFAGDRRPQTADAYTVIPLTERYDKVDRALERLLEEGPNGRTNIFAGVHAAATELIGGIDAASEPRPDARKVVLFMTDGQPTLPDPKSRMDNARMAIAAAKQLSRKNDIRFDTFAIGKVATDDPMVTEEMAGVSDGVFTPVRQPQDLIAAFEDLDLADIERLEIRNKTTGKLASDVLLDADGSFSAFVDLARGENKLEILARSTDQTEDRVQVAVHMSGGKTRALPARLLTRRKRLLENKLLIARERRVAIELDRKNAVLDEIEAKMQAERERIRQRDKDLQIEVPASRRK